MQRQAVVTAPAAGRDEQVIRHLGEGQGDHDEIDATRAQADGADDQREQPGDAHGSGKGEQRLVDAGLLADGRGIGAGTEEGRVAERHHAAEAEDEIEAGSGQRKDQHAGGEADVELLAEGSKCARQGQCGTQEQQGERLLPGSGAVEGHLSARRKEALRLEEQDARHQQVNEDGSQCRAEGGGRIGR